MANQLTGNKISGSTARERISKLPKETPQFRLIERLLRVKASGGLRSRHFWLIAAEMAGIGVLYYEVVTTAQDLFVMLFFYPLIYAAIAYRLKGVIISGLVFIGILLPQALPISWEVNSVVRYIVFVSFPFVIGSLVATQLNYLEQRLEAYREIVSLNEELNENIERLENTQKQLIHAEKLNAIGQLAASVAHEINNPLAGVLVYSKLLAKKMNNESFNRAEAIVTLSKIDTAINHCSKIIRGLLDFSRQSEPGSQPVAISKVWDQILALVEHQAVLNHVTIIRQEEPSMPPVMADFGQLQQVFTNLALNAIQAMPQGGILSIDISLRVDGWVKVRVKDTGTGISPENMEKIFTPFFTTKEPGKGVGLGLAISYGIIEQHGGKIEVESAPGKGTTFTVSLPAYTFKGEVG